MRRLGQQPALRLPVARQEMGCEKTNCAPDGVSTCDAPLKLPAVSVHSEGSTTENKACAEDALSEAPTSCPSTLTSTSGSMS